MRTVTFDTRQMLEDAPTAQLLFATVTHPRLERSLHLVTDGVDHVLGGDLYVKGWFRLSLVTDGAAPPRAELEFPNTARARVARLEKVSEPARVSFKVIPAGFFDPATDPRQVRAGMTPEPVADAEDLYLVDIQMSAARVRGTLRSWDYRQTMYPRLRATEDLLPGVHYR